MCGHLWARKRYTYLHLSGRCCGLWKKKLRIALRIWRKMENGWLSAGSWRADLRRRCVQRRAWRHEKLVLHLQKFIVASKDADAVIYQHTFHGRWYRKLTRPLVCKAFQKTVYVEWSLNTLNSWRWTRRHWCCNIFHLYNICCGISLHLLDNWLCRDEWLNENGNIAVVGQRRCRVTCKQVTRKHHT